VAVTCPILIVDDDADVRYLLSLSLKSRGFEVDAVESAVCCLERLETTSICVVITDVQMPGMSGIELCAAVRALHPETVAIVMSGAASPSLAAAAIHSGAFTFLAKPVNTATLNATLLSAIATVEAAHHGGRS
jgi:DNA-binding NtrC family response regulator